MEFFWLALGLALLVFGGDALVKGSVGLAEKLGIPTLVIGLTIVAFGTSAPELFISVKAALGGAPGIAIGNVIGSNIANVLLVMGIPAVIAASRCDDTGIGRNMIVMIGFTLVFIAMLMSGSLTRFEGVILISLLLLFIADQIRTARKSKSAAAAASEEVPEHPTSNMLITGYLIGGVVLLPLGAHWTVEIGHDHRQKLGCLGCDHRIDDCCHWHIIARACDFCHGNHSRQLITGDRQCCWLKHFQHRLDHGHCNGYQPNGC